MEVAARGLLLLGGGGDVRSEESHFPLGGLWGRLCGGLPSWGVILTTVTIEMRGAVKLFATLLALVDGHLVEERMAVQVVRTVETLPANLAEEDLVLGVRVHEDVSLEQVLLREALTAHLAGHRHVFPVSFTCCAVQALQRLAERGAALDEGQPLLVDLVLPEQSAHERTGRDGIR